MKKQLGVCELCGREDLQITVHHLIPKEMGGTFGPIANLCLACHKQIHALYTNEELAGRLYTIEALQADQQIASFLKWVCKQPSSKLVRTKKSNERKHKKR
ncbi:HNH endonuclease [Bacillus sp. 165]|uniref:HNH endonuclease n=1 Tax=Bacillus sp. 165 TaxID=1529117 RepID=UPI001ADA3D6E|nr:HNH endonuclease [Bacillus sp. 165]MBO9128703.1 HNH endonuclease [Bacillus sp. 165]